MKYFLVVFVVVLVALPSAFGEAGPLLSDENAKQETIAEPSFFPRQESCPKNFFWQTVVNKTPFNIRIFIDGKPFSTEIYALNPKMITNEIDQETGEFKEFYYGATRCFPEGKHKINIIAFSYEKLPLSKYGKIEILRGEKGFFYDSKISDKKQDQYLKNPLLIEEKGLDFIASLGRKNAEHNIGLVFLFFFTVFAVGIVFFAFTALFRHSRNCSKK